MEFRHFIEHLAPLGKLEQQTALQHIHITAQELHHHLMELHEKCDFDEEIKQDLDRLVQEMDAMSSNIKLVTEKIKNK